jgi:hypothetical protein
MGKILAIVFLVIGAWFAVPKIAQAQWFAPTLYPNYWWGQSVYNYPPQVAQRGYGWFNINFWGGQPSIQAGYTPGWNTYYTPPTQYYYGSNWNQIPYYGGPANAYYGSYYAY